MAQGTSNPATDLKKVAGTAVDVNTGNASAGTQRVVLATDQPAVPVSGTFWQATQPVSAASLPLPSGAATAAKQPALGTAGTASSDVITVQGIASGTPQPVSGNIAHGSGDSGNPIKVGTRAQSTPSSSAVEAVNDRLDLMSDLDGALIVRQSSPHGDYVSATVNEASATPTVEVLFPSAGASVKTCITDITIFNSSATTVYVNLLDNTTLKWVFPCPAGGGVTHAFRTPLIGTAATAWNISLSAAAATVYVSAAGYKSRA